MSRYFNKLSYYTSGKNKYHLLTFLGVFIIILSWLEPYYFRLSGEFKCPAEENANCEKSPLINARKNCGKTDIRTNKLSFFTKYELHSLNLRRKT
jgi:hypothetical protein